MKEVILDISNLSISFDNNRILNNFKYAFKENTIYALMGANGSGKTTLFNIINGFIKSDAGVILLKNSDITSSKPHEIANYGISRTFQDMRLIPSLTVYENILLAIKHKDSEKLYNSFLPLTHSIYKDKIEKILTTTHLEDVKHSKAEYISYGQQKLLNLAVAMANDFDVLLLDEPIAGIQPEYRKEILTLIKNFHKTVIVIEHNPDFINELTDNVLFLDDGNIIATGTYEQIASNKRVQEAYL